MLTRSRFSSRGRLSSADVDGHIFWLAMVAILCLFVILFASIASSLPADAAPYATTKVYKGGRSVATIKHYRDGRSTVMRQGRTVATYRTRR